MFDAEFAKWVATLGVGGVLAGFMFAFYRKDIKQYTELWKNTADQLMVVVKENSASNTRLIVMLEVAERNQLRKSDLDIMMQQVQTATAAARRASDLPRPPNQL